MRGTQQKAVAMFGWVRIHLQRKIFIGTMAVIWRFATNNFPLRLATLRQATIVPSQLILLGFSYPNEVIFH